jgi:hypothetical protein
MEELRENPWRPTLIPAIKNITVRILMVIYTLKPAIVGGVNPVNCTRPA